jgi:hypothetical protein
LGGFADPFFLPFPPIWPLPFSAVASILADPSNFFVWPFPPFWPFYIFAVASNLAVYFFRVISFSLAVANFLAIYSNTAVFWLLPLFRHILHFFLYGRSLRFGRSVYFG